MASATQTSLAYDGLRADILACRLAPGARIPISRVARDMAVSVGAVREALSRLAAENMAVATAQKGFSVPPVSAEDLLDLTRTRVSVEQLCLAASIARGDVEWEVRAVAAFHRLQRLPERNPADQALLDETWSEAHAEFHAALVGACPSRWLLRMRAMLYEQTERYRRLSIPLRRGDRDVIGEHRALLEAVLARDVERASNLIDDHLMRTTAIVVAAPLFAAQVGRAASADDRDRKPFVDEPTRED